MTAKLDGIVTAQQSAPTPARMMKDWFPAAVKLPGETDLRAPVRIQATDVGLFVFEHRPVDETDLRPLFFSPIDWSMTTNVLPPRNVPLNVATEAGMVNVVAMAGCGCAYAALKYWVPSWASRTIQWGGGVDAS